MIDRSTTTIMALGLLVLLTGCGDPGTGGSGVPPGGSGVSTTPVVTPGGGTNAGTSATQTSSGAISSITFSIPGNAATSPTIAQIVVNQTRFDINAATLTGPDGSARTSDRLQVGVPVTLTFPVGADLAAAALNATGAAIDVSGIIIADPQGASLTAGATQLLLDDGRMIAVTPQAIVAGSPNGTGRVKAWIVTASDGSIQLTRYEYE